MDWENRMDETAEMGEQVRPSTSEVQSDSDMESEHSSPEPLTQGEVENMLAQVRNYYKGDTSLKDKTNPEKYLQYKQQQLKSGNKKYANLESAPDGPAYTARSWRNHNAQRVNNQLSQPRELWNDNEMDIRTYGEHLLENSVKFGNCGEMVAAAIKFIEEDPAAQIKVKGVFVAQVGDRSDIDGTNHDLIILSRDGSEPPWSKLSEIGTNRMSRGNFWVVDPWMNVACEVSEYKAGIENKLAKWGSENKYVSEPERAYEMSDPAQRNTYYRTLIEGEISYTGYNLSAESDDESDDMAVTR